MSSRKVTKAKLEVVRLRRLRKKYKLKGNDLLKINGKIKAYLEVIKNYQTNRQNNNLWKITTQG